ncbi:MAG TPA: FtsX-like permease family protein [Bdellovibrionota bacterium]|nr:FtsX-like permease family protein [Bdellovibrionota bacterium]
MSPVLIRYLSFRHARKHFPRTLLTVSGVALGVAVVIAIQAVNYSILESFRKMVDSISGRANLEVTAGAAGVPEELWERLEKLPHVQYVTPILQQTLRIPQLGNETILLMGIDFTGDEKFRDYTFSKEGARVDDPLAFLNDPDAILISERLSKRYYVKEGDTLSVLAADARRSLRVRGLLREEGPAKAFGGSLAVMDIYASQAFWGRDGKFDRFDLIVEEKPNIQSVKTEIRQALGNDFTVDLPRARGENATKLLTSFQVGLSVGGFVALLVGLFLIYNTMQIAVAQRQKEIGIARALGARRRDMIFLFIGESLTLGILGSAIGVGVGLWLARGLLATVSGAVSMHFLKVNPDEVYVTPAILGLGFLAGVASAVIAALGPARRAASVTPVEGIRVESRARHFRPTFFTINARISYGLAALALVLRWIAPDRQSLYWGYGAQLAMIFAFAFLAPTLLVSVGRLLRPVVHRLSGPAERLAFDQIQRQVSRSAVTIAAIMIGFGMVVEIANYIGSLKHTVQRWVAQSIPADIFVTSGTKLAYRQNTPIRETLADDLLQWPEVEAVDRVRTIDVRVGDTDVPLIANIPEVYLTHVQRDFILGTKAEALARMNKDLVAVVADNFLRRFHKKLGDTVPIQTPRGIVSFEIIGAIEDYTSDRGLVAISRNQFIAHFDDRLVDSFDVYVRDKSKIESVRQRILNKYSAELTLFALTNQEMKTEIFRIIDETYKVIRVLEIIAVLVSLLGIVNTLLASILERTRELGVLRAIGATRRQIGRMVIAEGAYLTLGGMFLGFLLGVGLTEVIFSVILPQSTGWYLTLSIPWLRISVVASIGLVLSMFAAYYPARQAARLNLVRAIEYE